MMSTAPNPPVRSIGTSGRFASRADQLQGGLCGVAFGDVMTDTVGSTRIWTRPNQTWPGSGMPVQDQPELSGVRYLIAVSDSPNPPGWPIFESNPRCGVKSCVPPRRSQLPMAAVNQPSRQSHLVNISRAVLKLHQTSSMAKSEPWSGPASAAGNMVTRPMISLRKRHFFRLRKSGAVDYAG
jgi:hypothetical protein